MSEFNNLVNDLRPSGLTTAFIENNTPWVEDRARAIGVTARFVISRTLLHLPKHLESDMTDNTPGVIEDIEPRVDYLGTAFNVAYRALSEQSEMRLVTPGAKLKGRKELHVYDGIDKIPVSFDDVPPETARNIQDRLHYIGSSRKDSVLDCGLYLDEAETPYACTSFSACNRGYQVDSLNKATGLKLKPEEVLSMTRAFSFDGAPANSMSKLFHLAQEQIKQRFPSYRAIVTALNPYLLFNGGIFTGSSYTPYAIAPMEYWYDATGFYVPRSKGQYPQQQKTPSIIWLAHGLDTVAATAIDTLEINSVVNVSREEYRNG